MRWDYNDCMNFLFIDVCVLRAWLLLLLCCPTSWTDGSGWGMYACMCWLGWVGLLET
ncbi:hypothetical protein BDW59DRAFT_150544 [Aspergillus cavernicola]|uniref:Uncharacterized protein n=1 Tax=Aspergillus cavernicola TaxID=176166 RepID=A0ABR4HZ84_9EURO